MIHGLGEGFKRKVIVTYNDLKAKEIYEDYRLYDKNVLLYPSKDIIFYSADIHGNAIVRERMRVLSRIIENEDITIIVSLDGEWTEYYPCR